MISDELRKRIDKAIKDAHHFGRTYRVPATDISYGSWYDANWGNALGKRTSDGRYQSDSHPSPNPSRRQIK